MLLKTGKLCKQYERGNMSFWAVDNIDLSINSNEFVSIIVRSGSGKTTLLNLIAGILSPTSGEIIFNGIDIGGLDDEQMSVLRNRQMGYIPQGGSLLANLTVLDNVRLPFYLSKHSGDAFSRAQELLEQVGIGHLRDMYPAAFPVGKRGGWPLPGL